MDKNNGANAIRNRYRNREVESANEAYERAMAELEALTGRSQQSSDASSYSPAAEEPANAYQEPAYSNGQYGSNAYNGYEDVPGYEAEADETVYPDNQYTYAQTYEQAEPYAYGYGYETEPVSEPSGKSQNAYGSYYENPAVPSGESTARQTGTAYRAAPSEYYTEPAGGSSAAVGSGIVNGFQTDSISGFSNANIAGPGSHAGIHTGVSAADAAASAAGAVSRTGPIYETETGRTAVSGPGSETPPSKAVPFGAVPAPLTAVPPDTNRSETSAEPAEAAASIPDGTAVNSGKDYSDSVFGEETADTDKPKVRSEDEASDTDEPDADTVSEISDSDNDSEESSEKDDAAADLTENDQEPDPDTSVSADKKKSGRKKSGKKNKNKKKRRGISKGFVYLIVLFECMVLVVALVIFSHSVSINRNDKLAYNDPAQVDEISCYDGTLNVNNVSVTVPAEKNVTYKKSYTWSPEDKEYPTIPHAVTAAYYNDEGTLLYDISLYRESFTKKADIPKKKNAANWFSDWKTVSDDNSSQEAKDIGDIHGFLITTKEKIEEGDTGTTYAGTTYYFTSQDENGLSVYILEGILYDAESLDAYNVAINNAMTSLTINQQAA